ncbi:hypothetical protein B0H13DRAFT_1855277 [Mycena leptocephala]|nr:hypothetical protein B0H13DRAFT_1855277 [Mycena leptocephala]
MSHRARAVDFILSGIELQEAQRRLAATVDANLEAPTIPMDLEIFQRRALLRTRIHAFRAVQNQFMPNACRLLTMEERMRWNSQAYVHPEHIPLFLPSEIADHNQRVASCVAGLPDLEFDLRQGEVRDAARRIQQLSITRRMSAKSQMNNIRGARALGRGYRVLREMSVQTQYAMLRHQCAMDALTRLQM